MSIKVEFNKYEEEFLNSLRLLRSIQTASDAPKCILVESEGELSELEGYLIGEDNNLILNSVTYYNNDDNDK